jgi:hypothetical protein
MHSVFLFVTEEKQGEFLFTWAIKAENPFSSGLFWFCGTLFSMIFCKQKYINLALIRQ